MKETIRSRGKTGEVADVLDDLRAGLNDAPDDAPDESVGERGLRRQEGEL